MGGRAQGRRRGRLLRLGARGRAIDSGTPARRWRRGALPVRRNRRLEEGRPARPSQEMSAVPSPAVSFAEALRVWLKIGCLGFGRPAGQIALMHRILVDEKRWVEESRYLHALNFCMLLPGPEAQKLATYVGWLLHGVRGGLAAGILFVLPGALVMLGVSLLYVLGRGVPVVEGALFGIKAAVLGIVVEALIRIGRRSLKTAMLIGLSGLAFLGIFFLDLPFPLIVAAAGALGFVVTQSSPALLGLKPGEVHSTAPTPGRWQQALGAAAIGLCLWWTPVALAALLLG